MTKEQKGCRLIVDVEQVKNEDYYDGDDDDDYYDNDDAGDGMKCTKSKTGLDSFASAGPHRDHFLTRHL